MERAAYGALYEGIRTGDRNWIDHAVGDEEVAVLWTNRTHHFTTQMNEFFSRSVGPVYTLEGAMPGGFPETPVTVDEETGELRRADGSTVEAAWVLTDGSVAVDGEPVKHDSLRGLTLYRVHGPVISTTSVDGVYNDQWSGPEVTYRRVRCRGGTLTVTLESDPSLFDAPQRVSAESGGERVSVDVDPHQTKRLAVRLVPEDGVCTARFTIAPTKTPPADGRELGTHFRAFDYRR
jgi:hypothetical protein